MNYVQESVGLLDSSDIVQLADGLSVEGTALLDAVTGVRHTLRRPAAALLPSLQSGITLQKWIDECRLHDVGRLRAIRMLLSLNEIAGLYRYRNLNFMVRAFPGWIRIFLFGMTPIRLARRYPANVQSLSIICARAMVPLVVVTTLFWLVCASASLISHASIMLLGFWLWVVYVSNLMHELTHWKIASQQSAVCFVRRGLRIGVMHAPLTKNLERLSALLGPVVGILTVMLAAILLIVLHVSFQFVEITLTIGLFHALSWLPMYGDGKMLRTLRKVQYA